jgi:uncharacterized protein YpmB
MIDIILIIIGSLSMLLAVIGSIYLTKSNSELSEKEVKAIQLLREEKLLSKRKSIKKKNFVPLKINGLNNQDQNFIYKTAREKKLSVGELLLAARINSLK